MCKYANAEPGECSCSGQQNKKHLILFSIKGVPTHLSHSAHSITLYYQNIDTSIKQWKENI